MDKTLLIVLGVIAVVLLFVSPVLLISLAIGGGVGYALGRTSKKQLGGGNSKRYLP